MDIAGPPDIFKAKMSELMRTLDQSEVDLLTKHQVTKASLSEHLDTIKRYSQGCEKQALNNAAKSKFCAHGAGYLEYILTRNRIKPQSHEIEVNSQYILTLMSTSSTNSY